MPSLFLHLSILVYKPVVVGGGGVSKILQYVRKYNIKDRLWIFHVIFVSQNLNCLYNNYPF